MSTITTTEIVSPESVEFDQCFKITEDGMCEPVDYVPGAPGDCEYVTVYPDAHEDADAQIDSFPEWTAVRGFTGQYGYNGPAMHASESPSARMMQRVREEYGNTVYVLTPIAYACETCGMVNYDDCPDCMGEYLNTESWAVFARTV